jgi:hypothetical protein
MDFRGLRIGDPEGLDRLEGAVEHRELPLDRQLVMGELGGLLPGPLFHDDDLETGGGKHLGQYSARRAGSDNDEIDGILLAVRTLPHPTCLVAGASYHP